MQLTSEILLETAYLCVLWGALGAALGLLGRQGIEAYAARSRRLLRLAQRAVIAEAIPTPIAAAPAPIPAAPPAPAYEITTTVPAASTLSSADVLFPEPRTSPARP